MNKLIKLAKMPKSDRFLLLETFILLSLIRMGLFFLSFSRLRDLLDSISDKNRLFKATQNSVLGLTKIINTVHSAARYMPGNPKCLAKALTTQVLMKRSGYIPDLKIGVAKENGELQAHAWVEHQGKVVIGQVPNLDIFKPITSI